MRGQYIKPISEISEFKTTDVITTSDDNFEGFEPQAIENDYF